MRNRIALRELGFILLVHVDDTRADRPVTLIVGPADDILDRFPTTVWLSEAEFADLFGSAISALAFANARFELGQKVKRARMEAMECIS